MNRKKLIISLSVALVALGGGWKFGFAKEAETEKGKIRGDVYVLGKDFLVNLADGHFAKLGVALVVEHGTAAPPAGDGHGAAPPKPPEGYGSLPQEALVRDIVTDTLTDAEGAVLTSRKGREALKAKIVKRIKSLSDVPIHEVLFTDVSVQ